MWLNIDRAFDHIDILAYNVYCVTALIVTALKLEYAPQYLYYHGMKRGIGYKQAEW